MPGGSEPTQQKRALGKGHSDERMPETHRPQRSVRKALPTLRVRPHPSENNDMSASDSIAPTSVEPNSNDPLRVYLRKMGTVPLLTREGEVELAKRIEEGTNAVRDALFSSSVVIEELTRMGEQLAESRLRARELL